MLATSFAVMIGSRWMSSAMPVTSSILGGHGRRRGQRDERVERPVVHRRQLAAPRIGRLPARRNVRVLGDDERVEPALLDRPRQRHRVDAVVGHERGDPDFMKLSVVFSAQGRYYAQYSSGSEDKRFVRRPGSGRPSTLCTSATDFTRPPGASPRRGFPTRRRTDT